MRAGLIVRVALVLVCGLFAIAMPAHAERIRVFGEPNFEGWNRVLLSNQAALNDGRGYRVRSAKVMSGSWLLCSDSSFGGNCLWLAQSLSDFGKVGFDHPIISAKPLRVVVSRFHWGGKRPPYRSVVMFDGVNYKDEWKAISENVPSLHPLLRPQSVVVQQGVWQLCSDEGYAGRCIILTGDVWDFREIFRSPIQSIRRIEHLPQAHAERR